MANSDPRRYRFGPLERRGVIGSFRATQVVLVGGAVAVAVVLIHVAATPVGVIAALGLIGCAAVAAFFPIAGRSAEEWSPVALTMLVRRMIGRHRHRSRAPTAGIAVVHAGEPEGRLSLPACLNGLELMSVPVAGDEIGIMKDRRARTYTGVLAVRVASFGLLDRAEQERRIAGWGWVLASLASEGSAVSRIQWIERTVPADGDEIGRYLGEAWDREPSPRTRAMQSYLELIDHAGAATQDHELFVCLQIDARRGMAPDQEAGQNDGPDAGACALLLRELETVRRAARRRRRCGVGRAAPTDARSRDPPRVRPLRPAASHQQAQWGRELARRRPRVCVPHGSRRFVELLPHRRGVPRDLLDRGLAKERRRRGVPRAPADAHDDGPNGLRDDGARPAVARVSRGRSRAHSRRRRPRASAPHGLPRDGPEAQAGGGDGAPRGGARRRPRLDPVRRIRHRVRPGRSPSRALVRRDRARRAEGAARAAAVSTASRTPRSPTRCRSAGGSDDLARHMGRHGHRATTAHVQAAYPFVAEGGLGGRGVYIGRDVYGGSFCYDPWELYGRELTSPNCSSPASSAAPSRRLVKTYLWRQHVFGRQAWVVDVKGEYEPLAEALGVVPITLRPGGDVRLNPLTPPRDGTASSISSRASPRAHSGGRSRRRKSWA